MGLTGLATSRWAAATVGMGNKCNVIKKVKSASGKGVALPPPVSSRKEQSNSCFYSRGATELPQGSVVAKQS